MIKYNDDNIKVGQIKQLLHTFNLPNCNIYKEGMTLCTGLHYIKNDAIYVCDISGNLVRECSYNFGGKYEGITTNLRLTSNVYDSYTHKYLGRYLRFIRDYSGVDLMSMYNCFSNELVKNFDVTVNDVRYVSNANDYIIYAVPIRYGQKYSIYANSSKSIEMFAGYYWYDSILVDNEDTDAPNGVITGTYARSREIALDKPFVYDKVNMYPTSEKALKKEFCLNLFIKIPYSYKGSIVILEGDYSGFGKKSLVSGHKVNTGIVKFIPDGSLKPVYQQCEITKNFESFKKGSTLEGFSILGLLELSNYTNATANYLVSTRLMEYLTGNAITTLSEGYDIKKMQQELISNRYVESDYLGEWSNEDNDGLAKFISDYDINSKHFDVIGYCDKDVEEKMVGLPHKNGKGYL